MNELTDEEWELMNTLASCPQCGEDMSADELMCFQCRCAERGCAVPRKGTFTSPHYHCGGCDSPETTSYQGHYGLSDDGRWGFSCRDYAV